MSCFIDKKQRMENIIYFENTMERSLQNRFLNSQDHLIISLNQQIESMIPLKDSYGSLQRYHIKLLHDLQGILAENDQVSAVYSSKIHELSAINEQLDFKKNQYIEELRNLQNQKAKLVLQRKNLMSSCQTLSSKFNLENEQSVMLQERAREIMQSIKKTEQNIGLYRKIINQIESQIRIKLGQSSQIENEILRKVELNRRSTQKIQVTQSEIKSLSIKNQKNIKQIKSIDKTQEEIQFKIRQELRKIKDLNEKILGRKQQLANLNHQKQYYTRLIQSQLLIKEDLDLSQNKLSNVLERRLKQCEKVSKQNSQLQQKIRSQQNNHSKSQKYKQALKVHLGELVKTNTILLETMRKSCKQDERAQQILNKKLDHLDCALIRSSDIQNIQVIKKSFHLKDKTNEFLSTKAGQKSGSSWINQLCDFENN